MAPSGNLVGESDLPLELVQAIEQLNYLLDEIRRTLPTKPDGEFGDNTQALQVLDARRANIVAILHTLRPQFKFNGGNLANVNPFFALQSDTELFERELIQIKHAATASTEHRRDVVKRLESFWQHLAELWYNARLPTFPYQSQADAFGDAVETTQVTEEARAFILQNLNQLRSAWQNKNGKSIPELLRKLDYAASQQLKRSFHLLTALERIGFDEDDIVVQPFHEPGKIEHCWAVIVGVGRHLDSFYGELPHAARDARAMASLLSNGARGYAQVRIRLFYSNARDDSQAAPPAEERALCWTVDNALKYTAKQAKSDDLLLFYFSGHGVLENNVASLVFEDTYRLNFATSALQMEEVLRILNNSQAGVKVLILDTCHSGAAIDGRKEEPVTMMTSEFLRRVQEGARGIIVMTSCAADESSYPFDEHKHASAFTHFFIEHCEHMRLTSPHYVTSESVKTYISAHMQEWRHKNRKTQTPQFFTRENASPIIIDWTNLEQTHG